MAAGLAALMLTFKQAAKIAPAFYGRKGDVQLFVSLDRRTTLSIGWFRSGPRGGRAPCYAVRLGVDHQGVAMNGCCLADDEAAALEIFNRYAGQS